VTLSALGKRIRKLEIVFSKLGGGCTCRPGQETAYHTPEDLEGIMAVGCPVHGFRDLGRFCWVPKGSPLRLEDRDWCRCPVNPTRDWLAGTRGPLSQEEVEEECRGWQRAFSSEEQQTFPAQQARVTELIRNYLRRLYAAMRS
jgi:hypothetical protein